MWASIALTVCSIYNVVNNFSLLLLNPLLLNPLLLNPLLLNPLLLNPLLLNPLLLNPLLLNPLLLNPLLHNPPLLNPLLLNPLLLKPLLLGALFALTMFKVTTWLMLVCFSQYASAGCLICPNLCSKLPHGYSFSSFSLLLLGASFALTICSTGSPRCMLQSATLSFVIVM